MIFPSEDMKEIATPPAFFCSRQLELSSSLGNMQDLLHQTSMLDAPPHPDEIQPSLLKEQRCETELLAKVCHPALQPTLVRGTGGLPATSDEVPHQMV